MKDINFENLSKVEIIAGGGLPRIDISLLKEPLRDSMMPILERIHHASTDAELRTYFVELFEATGGRVIRRVIYSGNEGQIYRENPFFKK